MQNNNAEYELFDSKKTSDKNTVNIPLPADEIINLKIIPYYKNNENFYFGEPIYLNTIKTPANNAGENWWNNNFD